jgi:hypothetical protein
MKWGIVWDCGTHTMELLRKSTWTVMGPSLHLRKNVNWPMAQMATFQVILCQTQMQTQDGGFMLELHVPALPLFGIALEHLLALVQDAHRFRI